MTMITGYNTNFGTEDQKNLWEPPLPTIPVPGSTYKPPGTTQPTTPINTTPGAIPGPTQGTTQPGMAGYIQSQVVDPTPTVAKAQYANPWDDPNYQQAQAPSPYANQGAAMTQANQQAEKDRYLQQQAGKSQAAAQAQTNPGAPAPTAPAASTAAGNGLKAPGPITEFGTEYQDYLRKRLGGYDPESKTARMNEDTAAARRAYAARQSTEEALGQSTFQPGTAQYQRALDRSQAGVNAANQQGEVNVAAYTRARSEDAQKQAADQEREQMGYAVNERTRNDFINKDYENSLPEGKTRYAYRSMVNSGMSPEDAYKAIVGQTGEIGQTYRGATAGANTVKGIKDEAEAFVSATTDLKPGTKEFEAEVRKRVLAVDTTTQKPLNDATTAKETQELTAKAQGLKPGEFMKDDEFDKLVSAGTIPTYSASSLPTGSEANAILAANSIGGLINMDGEQYRVVNSSDPRTHLRSKFDVPLEPKVKPGHTGMTTLMDSNGKLVYVYDGAKHDNPPKTVEKAGALDYVTSPIKQAWDYVNPFD